MAFDGLDDLIFSFHKGQCVRQCLYSGVLLPVPRNGRRWARGQAIPGGFVKTLA